MTRERALELLSYDPLTGSVIRRINSRRGPAKAGDLVGWMNTTGYLQVSLDSKEYCLHRVIYLMVVGTFPPEELDHKDRVRTNNAWTNLVLANRSQNCMNKPPRKKSSSKYKGVSWDRKSKSWRVQLNINGKRTCLGWFNNEDEAAQVYNLAVVDHHSAAAFTNIIGR